MLRHVRDDFVVGGQGRGRFPDGVAVTRVSVQHILFIKISCIIFGRRHLRGILISRRLVIADEPTFVPPPGGDFPNDRLCRRVGIIHRGYAELLGRSGWEAVHGYQHEQIPLGLVELVLPVWGVHQIPVAGGIGIEFPVAGAVVHPLVNAVKVCFAVVLRGVLAPVHLEDVNRISFVPVQPVVVVIAPIAAVAGAGRFAGLTPAVNAHTPDTVTLPVLPF